MSDFRFFVDERSCRERTFKEIKMHLQMIYGDDKVGKYMVFIFMYFLPRINLFSCKLFAWFCLFPIPYMVITLQIVSILYACVQGALKQGQKDRKSLQKQKCFLSYACSSLCVPNSSLFLSFPGRQKLLGVGKKIALSPS